ncbi:DNA polymerase IV [Marinomonas mediterranea]|uniref:DNA polymerase IV n=1 Tax=Marinomonas mediterranea TaxID=119864 RepID=UPI00234BFA09|nr:DNA polymerase IV [Marinomonas mediterranea]WCN12118.1 DNA polymerase IV [Marinomonas mediterranea]
MRKVIHIDADCFYAAVEMRDDPSLKDLPVAIGGPSNSRGVLATANYKAREFGVRSAMPSSLAKRLCPDLLIIPGNMSKYREASQQMHEIFRDYTDIIEPLSLDEAYLDVSNSTAFGGSATLIAQDIRKRIECSIGITVSAGVATNKFLAKVASDWNKPNGIKAVTPDELQSFVENIPVARISGVGKVAQEKLQRMGVVVCRDLKAVPLEQLIKSFGSMAYRLLQFSQGIDDRPVQVSRERKSVSVEHTFAHDLNSVDESVAQLPNILEELKIRVKRNRCEQHICKYYLKLKFNDFTQTTIERPIVGKLEDSVFTALLIEAHARHNKPVRLIGAGYRLTPPILKQLELFPSH